MAGGRGSRLRPITDGRPKPLCTLLGKPVVFYILDLLKREGVDEAVITLGYQGKLLEEALEEYEGISLRFSREKSPLGTAGGVLKAAGGFQEDFIVISGDAMCDFDLRGAMAFHREKKAAATIVAHRVADPREYGLICADGDGRVTSFVEKPSYAGCVTDLANTGVYILSPEVLKRVPAEKMCDFAKDVFPAMLKEDSPIYHFEDNGYWCDIGDIRSYLYCQKDMLWERLPFQTEAVRFNGNLLAGRIPFGSYEIHPPVYIGKNVSIGRGAVIGPDTVLEDNVSIGGGCRVQGSVLMKGVSLDERVSLNQVTVCEGACLENDSSALPMSVVGRSAVVRRDALIGDGIRVWEERVVGEGVILREDLKDGTAKELLLEEDGLIGQTNITITPEVCIRLGAGTASLQSNAAVAVGYSKQNASKALASACISGILAAGGQAWDFGPCLESQFLFAMDKGRADFGIYIDAGLTASLRITGRDGLPMQREMERKLEGALNRREYKRSAPDGMGGFSDMESVTKLYFYELLKLCDVSLDGISVQVRSVSREPRHILEAVLQKLGCELGGGILIRLSPDGKSAEMEDKETTLCSERVLAAVCLTEFLRGNNVSVPRTAPRAIDSLAELHGASVLRYSDCPCGEEDGEARRLAAAQPFLRDGLMMTIRILSFLSRHQMSLRELDSLLPSFSIASRLVSVSVSPGILLRTLKNTERTTLNGVELRNGGNAAFARPLKNGRGILLLAESMRSETAAEICDGFEAILQKAALDTGMIS